MPYEKSGLQKVPEQIACILACIAVVVFTSYLQTLKSRREGIYNAFFFHVCHLHFWDGEQKEKKKKAASYRFAEYTGHARKMEHLLD